MADNDIPLEDKRLPGHELSSVEDDATLVGRAQGGDHKAFATLLARYSGRIFGMALRMLGDRGDAEDVAQEVSVTAWRRLSELTDPAAVRTWLFRVTHRQCLLVLRRRRDHLIDVIPEDIATHHPACDPPRMAESVAAFQALSTALAHLPPPQLHTWLLAEIHGLPHLEIARISGGTEQAARARLARARASLAAEMRAWR